MARASQTPEVPRSFIATPERVSKYLELKSEEVLSQMKSVEGRRMLFEQLMEKEADLKRDHKEFNAESMRHQLDAAGEALIANERYVADIRSPEKKSVMRRVWETIKGFPRKHPVVTLVLAAAAAGGIASYLGYLPALNFEAWWQKLKGLAGFGGGAGASGAASESINAVEVARKTAEAAENIPSIIIRTFGHQAGYGDALYEMKDLPSLIQALPDMKPGQVIEVLRDSSSKAGLEVELRRLIQEKYGDTHMIDWGGTPP